MLFTGNCSEPTSKKLRISSVWRICQINFQKQAMPLSPLRASPKMLLLQIDFAIVFYLLAVLQNIFHNSLRILALFTPAVFFAASSILFAQFAQSTSILYVFFMIVFPFSSKL